MFFTKIKRTIKSGAISFWRNSSVSLASVLIMTVTLTVISMIIFFGIILSSTLENIKNKVDINVYFDKNASEIDIKALQTYTEKLSEVSDVEYVSKEDAYANFRKKHAEDKDILASLDEIDTNPLPSSLNIKAKDTNLYDIIIEKIRDKEKSLSNSSIIEKINYTKNKEAIEAISRIMSAAKKIGSIIAIFFALVSILITFNTIRLAIYIFREEIAVMRLVGASETYVRGPFVTVGILYGVVSGILTILILLPLTHELGIWTNKLGTGIDLFAFYKTNLAMIILYLTLAGAVLGAISSFLAIRRYMKV